MLRNFIFYFVFLSSVIGFAHGEDAPGPHKGYIKMPGPFHTELVPDKKGIVIYLLDMEFKNPTVENSQVSVVVQDTKTVKCLPKDYHFFCAVPLPKGGSVKVISTRMQAKGNTVVYDLPLKSFGQKDDKKNHGMHH